MMKKLILCILFYCCMPISISAMENFDFTTGMRYTKNEAIHILKNLDDFSREFWVSFVRDDKTIEMVYKNNNFENYMLYEGGLEAILNYNRTNYQELGREYYYEIYSIDQLYEPMIIIQNGVLLKNNLDTNFNVTEYERALKYAQSKFYFLNYSRYSLLEVLEEVGFSRESAQYAVENVNVDWEEEALMIALFYVDMHQMGEDELRDNLDFEEFTEDEIDYAIDYLDSW